MSTCAIISQAHKRKGKEIRELYFPPVGTYLWFYSNPHLSPCPSWELTHFAPVGPVSLGISNDCQWDRAPPLLRFITTPMNKVSEIPRFIYTGCVAQQFPFESELSFSLESSICLCCRAAWVTTESPWGETWWRGFHSITASHVCCPTPFLLLMHSACKSNLLRSLLPTHHFPTTPSSRVYTVSNCSQDMRGTNTVK